MKLRHMKTALALLASLTGTAYAQSSVTLYGIIDAGVNYISNDGGKSNYTMTTGVVQGNRFGFRGVEDLGGGWTASFVLENGFLAQTGTLAQGGRLFGRQAWVAIGSPSAGTLSFGRQYDMSVMFVNPMTRNTYDGLAHPFDNDNLIASYRINNSVRYMSPVLHGFQAGVLYGFSNSTNDGSGGGFGVNRVWSVGAIYSGGGLTVASGWLHLNWPNSTTVGAVSGDYNNISKTSALGALGLAGPVQREDVFSAGIGYKLDKLTSNFVYSHSAYHSTSDRLSFDNYEVNAIYFLHPDLSLMGVYSFTDGKLASTGRSPKYHQAEVMADYFLSKRTDVYAILAYQRAAGDAPVASIAPDTFGAGGAYAPDASNSINQVLARIGLRHRF